MSKPDEGSLLDVAQLLVASVFEHIDAHPDRWESILAIVDKAKRRAAIEAFLLEAGAAFNEKMGERFPAGGYIYGSRDVKLYARELAIAEALQVRPALTMTEVFKRAGVSRPAGYRILTRLRKR